MTPVLPQPAVLALPPGRPAALADLMADVAAAAAHLRHLQDLLARPVATVASWDGADGDAARRQVEVVRALAEGAAGALEAAGARLAGHADLLNAARAAVAGLRDEQQDDIATVQRVLAGRALALPVSELADDPRTAAAVEEFAAAEGRRRLQHERLLHAVADDAARTAVVLTESTAVYGAGGCTGDDRAVAAHLATLLPGWGNAELARRGSALAESLVGESHTPEEILALAADAAVFAGSPAFAGALLAELGSGGVELLLVSLGMNRYGPPGPLAHLLASAFRAVGPAPWSREVAEAVTARYVDPDDAGPIAGYTAAGMAAVLAAGARHGQVPAATVASWSRQLFAREHRMQLPTGIGEMPPGWPRGTGDPAAYAVSVLAHQGDPAAAASLLRSREVWVALTARAWSGHPAAAEVVALAGRAGGGAAPVVLGLGLEVLGAGLADGDPDGWAVNRDTALALAGPLADGLAAHVDAVAEPLSAAATGTAGTRATDQLRGLGLVTLDPAATTTVARALAGWVGGRREAPPDPVPSLPAAEAIGAFVAVRQYGQRLDHALDGFELQSRAHGARAVWNAVTLPLELLSGPVGKGLGVLAGFTAIALDADGTWDDPGDRGRVFDRADAATAATAALSTASAERAAGAYERTTDLLGRPEAPRSPREDYLAPLTDAIAPDGKRRRSHGSADTAGDD